MRHKARSSIANKVINGFNSLCELKHPQVLISENHRHAFSFDKPRDINRKLSIWMKGIIQDRTEFKALEGWSLHKQVNPAYGSQTCPECGLLWSSNRKGDEFKCQMCGHEAGSDKVAAINSLRRSTDTAISLYMPYGGVRDVPMERFLRQLECESSLILPSGLTPETVTYVQKEWESLKRRLAKEQPQRTVPGRTVDTGGPYLQRDVGDESRTAEGQTPIKKLRQSIAGRNKALPWAKYMLHYALTMLEYVFRNSAIGLIRAGAERYGRPVAIFEKDKSLVVHQQAGRYGNPLGRQQARRYRNLPVGLRKVNPPGKVHSKRGSSCPNSSSKKRLQLKRKR